MDNQSYADYEQTKQDRLVALLGKAKDGSYRAPPVKRVYIPKDDGEKRGIGIPTIEDKILQRAVVMLLEPIYEQSFHDFSFGLTQSQAPSGFAQHCVLPISASLRPAEEISPPSGSVFARAVFQTGSVLHPRCRFTSVF